MQAPCFIIRKGNDVAGEDADWTDYIVSHFEEAGRHILPVRSQFDLGSPSNLVRLRDALIERDIIYSELKKLYLTDLMFGLWFRKRFI